MGDPDPGKAQDFTELEEIPRAVARRLARALEQLDRPGYVRFLNAMYHYTKGSATKIQDVVKASHHEDVTAFFERLEGEEDSHYKLAEADLKAMGLGVESEPPPAVMRFNASWRELSSLGCYAYLGAVYVFENIAQHLQGSGRNPLDRLGLDRKQTRWMRVHLEVDLEHGAAVAELCQRYFAVDPELMLRGARMAAHAWLDVFVNAMEGEGASLD